MPSLVNFVASRQLPHDVVVYSEEFVHLCFIMDASSSAAASVSFTDWKRLVTDKSHPD
jgi:hypothetical protein